MTIAVVFPGGNIPWKRLCQVKVRAKTTCCFGQNGLVIPPPFRVIWRRERDAKESKPRKIPSIVALKRSMSSDSSPLSASDTLKEFYECINEGNLNQLRSYIASDCYVEECSFVAPFQGKEEVLRFFDQLIASLGKNVKFKINRVCEGDADELVAAANWHLEWKMSRVPFTRGCSFLECSKEGDKIMIKRVQIVIESLVKPGGLVLTLLKIVTKVFDNFPNTTQWFLKSPDIVLKWLLRIYIVFFGIFIHPILKTYTQVWNLTSQLLGYAFQITLYILKFFIN